MKERKTGKTLVANEDTNFSTELLEHNEHQDEAGIYILLRRAIQTKEQGEENYSSSSNQLTCF
jgi:hypothetical protein